MQLKHFHLLFIIFAVLLLCSFLGGSNCYKEGMTEEIENNEEDKESGNNDEEVKIILVNKNGKVTGKIVEDGTVESVSSEKGSVNYYYGPNGEKVVAVTGPEGQKLLVDADDYSNTSTANTYTTSNNGETTVYYNQPYGNKVVTGPRGNKLVSGPYGNKVVLKEPDNTPLIDEDKYILKSQIVPPVCPACPGINPVFINGEKDEDSPDSYPVPLNNEITNKVKDQVKKRKQLRDDILNDASPEEIRNDIQDLARGRQEIASDVINKRVEARNEFIEQSKTYEVPTFKSSNTMVPKPLLSDFSKF